MRVFDSKRPLPTTASSGRPVTILFFGGLWRGPLLQELETVSNALGEGQVLVVQGGRGSLRPDEVITPKFVISTRPLPFDKINEYIATADVGLALYPERTANNSRYTAFAGEKVARYAQCGVPFIAFRSEDYEFLKAETGCCELVDDYGEIPAAINKILDNYESYRRGAYAAYDQFYRIENTGAELLRALDPTQNDTSPRLGSPIAAVRCPAGARSLRIWKVRYALRRSVFTHLIPKRSHLFASKGAQCWYQPGNMNGVKVRRVMQIIRDFAGAPFEQLRIFDFGCGEGVYAIEAALRGAEVVALDGRTERMNAGVKIAERIALSKLKFEQIDIRNVTVASHGSADVVLFLGILYHLSEHDVFSMLRKLHALCKHLLIIDTHIALQADHLAHDNGKVYAGTIVREHDDQDSMEIRRSRVGASLDNPLSFWFTRESLCRVLIDVGFTSVCECHVPLEPFKPANRITLIATKGEPVKLSSYPWVNGKTEEEIQHFLECAVPKKASQSLNHAEGHRSQHLAAAIINGMLRPIGVQISRIKKSRAKSV